MAMTRCENEHYYDSGKYTNCPACGVKGLEVGATRTMRIAAPTTAVDNVPPTQLHRDAPGGRADAGRTVSLMHRAFGMDPVVGWLVCIEGPERGRDYRLHAERNMIGRAQTMDVSIAGDESISRDTHAVVSFDPRSRRFRLIAGERRGIVYLNDVAVENAHDLAPYDIVQLGATKLLFVPLCGERFTWEALLG